MQNLEIAQKRILNTSAPELTGVGAGAGRILDSIIFFRTRRNQKMTDKKIDGYVAWHPVKCFKPGAICETPKQAIAIQQMTYALQPGAEEMLASGWRIRPVKLVFLDEDKKDDR